MTSTQIMLGGLSDNAIRWATVLAALSLLAYAAQWAYSRERATSDVDTKPRSVRWWVPALPSTPSTSNSDRPTS